MTRDLNLVEEMDNEHLLTVLVHALVRGDYYIWIAISSVKGLLYLAWIYSLTDDTGLNFQDIPHLDFIEKCDKLIKSIMIMAPLWIAQPNMSTRQFELSMKIKWKVNNK